MKTRVFLQKDLEEGQKLAQRTVQCLVQRGMCFWASAPACEKPVDVCTLAVPLKPLVNTAAPDIHNALAMPLRGRASDWQQVCTQLTQPTRANCFHSHIAGIVAAKGNSTCRWWPLCVEIVHQ